MIRFNCEQCGHKIGVQDKYVGKRGKCPECGAIVVIPAQSTIIECHCQNCDRKINVPKTLVGKEIQCPDCKDRFIVPAADLDISLATETPPTQPTDSTGILTPLDLPQEYRIADQPPDQSYRSQELTESERDFQAIRTEDEAESVTESELPWLIDIALYPFSAAGAVNLGIFCLGPPILGLINHLILSRIPFGTLIALVLFLLLVAYALHYLAFCTFDSSKGGRRAPDTLAQDAPDKSDLISQLFLTLGSIALCFWPAVVYSAWTGRTDAIFWLLSVCGLFFFPMALLAGTLFDAIHALNPIVIIVSIVRTLPRYLGLVLFFCIPLALVAAIIANISPQSALGMLFYSRTLINYFLTTAFIYKAIPLAYLTMIGAHLLGRFYWLHKDKLDWGL